MHVCSRVGVTSPRDRAHNGRGVSVRHDLDASVIRDRDDVHVGEANIAGDPRAAHPRNGPLEGQSSRCQHAKSSTCGPVVPERVEAAMAGATGNGKRSRRSSRTRALRCCLCFRA